MQNKNYLSGLNSIRFILTILVLMGHARLDLVHYNILNYQYQDVLYKGSLSVEFFFVLSGFILTHLAIAELEKTGKLNIKFFFLRRILRILPLYYLATLCSYLLLAVVYPILNGKSYLSFPWNEAIFYHIFLLPNLLVAQYGANMGSFYALWSIGVEEQFYLFFPLLLPFVYKQKNAIGLMLTLATLFFITYFYCCTTSYANEYGVLLRFAQTLKFHFMFLGCSAALVLHFYKDTIWKITQNTIIYTLIWLLFVSTLFSNFYHYDPYHILHGFIFCCLIFAVTNPFLMATRFLEYPFLHYLGSISYGIYMFHPILSYFVRFTMEKSPFLLELVQNYPFCYYLLLITITIWVAHLSFRYFESYFLGLKTKFS